MTKTLFEIDTALFCSALKLLKHGIKRSSFQTLRNTLVTADEETQTVTFYRVMDVLSNNFGYLKIVVGHGNAIVYDTATLLLDMDDKQFAIDTAIKKNASSIVTSFDDDGTVRLWADGSSGNARTVKCKKSDVSEFPTMESDGEVEASYHTDIVPIHINTVKLIEAMKYASDDITRKEFHTVEIQRAEKGTPLFAATDGYRLAMIRCDEAGQCPKNFQTDHIPKDYKNVLTAMASESPDGAVGFWQTEKNTVLSATLGDGAHVRLWNRRLNVEFPDFSKVIPNNYEDGAKFELPYGDMKMASNACANDMKNIDKTGTVQIDYNTGTAKKKNKSNEISDAILTFTVSRGKDTEHNMAAFNVAYIKDTIDTAIAIYGKRSPWAMHVIDPDYPAVVRCDDDGQLQLVVMPMMFI